MKKKIRKLIKGLLLWDILGNYNTKEFRDEIKLRLEKELKQVHTKCDKDNNTPEIIDNGKLAISFKWVSNKGKEKRYHILIKPTNSKDLNDYIEEVKVVIIEW